MMFPTGELCGYCGMLGWTLKEVVRREEVTYHHLSFSGWNRKLKQRGSLINFTQLSNKEITFSPKLKYRQTFKIFFLKSKYQNCHCQGGRNSDLKINSSYHFITAFAAIAFSYPWPLLESLPADWSLLEFGIPSCTIPLLLIIEKTIFTTPSKISERFTFKNLWELIYMQMCKRIFHLQALSDQPALDIGLKHRIPIKIYNIQVERICIKYYFKLNYHFHNDDNFEIQ